MDEVEFYDLSFPGRGMGGIEGFEGYPLNFISLGFYSMDGKERETVPITEHGWIAKSKSVIWDNESNLVKLSFIMYLFPGRGIRGIP